MKAGIIQQHNTADTADNIARLHERIRHCAAQGARLVVLQELHNSLYFCQTEDPAQFALAESIPGRSTRIFGALAKETGMVLALSLFERRAAGLYHNTAVVIERDGSIAGCYRKMHIPDDPAYYEKYYFAPGDTGFVPVDTSVGRLGVMICWDQWFPEAARLMTLRGADILICPTAIGWESTDTDDEKQRQREAWQTVQRGHAIANGLPLIAVNRIGTEPDPSRQTRGITFWGSSFAVGPQGEWLGLLSGEEEMTQVVDIDLSRSEHVRRMWPFLRDRRIDAFDGLDRRYLAE
ncbi:MAG: carbon-nitrogen hydrolase [Tannerella sp.]|jgi:N-carbamoylputrescine amidase|nr:carbon-nitrogen hydrolase [Tannerella sp.]